MESGRQAGLPEPEFSERDGFVTTLQRLVSVRKPTTLAGTPYVAPYEAPYVAPHMAVVVRLIGAAGELASPDLLLHLGLRDRKNLRERYLAPSLEEGWIEMTIPDKPRSRDQRYRLTARGKELLARLNETGEPSR